MTESEFQRYLDRLDAWDRNAITTALYSDLDPLIQQRHVFALREKAIKNQWMSAEEFEALYQAEIEKLNAGNEKRIEKSFAPFAPFASQGVDSLPRFPIEALPPALENYAREVAESKQVAEDMAAVAALGVVSLAVQGKFQVTATPGWTQPLNLYEIIVARPSDRKTPVLNAVMGPVYEYIQTINELRKEEVKIYNNNINILTKRKNSIIEHLGHSLVMDAKGAKDAKATENDLLEVQAELSRLEDAPVRPLKLLSDDTTPEALARKMADNGGKMAIVSSEGGIFDIIAGRYSDRVNLDIFLKSYDGESITVDRKSGESLQIPYPILTILLMTQPRVLTTIMENEDFRGRGFLARFLYSIPQSKVGTRRYGTGDISDQAKLAYRVLLKTLLDIPEREDPPCIQFSMEAHKLSEDFFYWLEPQLTEELEPIESWAAKFHGGIVRIAALLHCCQYIGDAASVPISGDTFLRARRIGEYFLGHAKAAFCLMGMSEPQEEKDAKYILRRLDTIEGDSTSVKSLYDLCQKKKGFETMELFREVLDLLVSRGYLYIETVATGGRPSEKVYINPEYLDAKGAKGAKGTEPIKS